MDAVDILKVCIRRWYVMLPILLGAAGVSYQLVQAQEPSYTAAASYGLVQSRLTGDDDIMSSPLGPAGDILVGETLEAQLNSRETQAKLGVDSGTRGWGPGDVRNNRYYDVRIPQFESTYEIRAWGEDELEVRDVVNRVIDAAPDIAEEAQIRAGVPVTQRYEPFVLAPTQVEELPSSGWVKLLVAVMGVGVMVGAAWSVLVDRMFYRRRRSRRLTSGADVPPPPTGLVVRETISRKDRSAAAAPGRGNDAGRVGAVSAPDVHANGIRNRTATRLATGRAVGGAVGAANSTEELAASTRGNGKVQPKTAHEAGNRPSGRR